MAGYGYYLRSVATYTIESVMLQDPTDPTKKQEIIGYTAGGDPISKGESTVPWMAWVHLP